MGEGGHGECFVTRLEGGKWGGGLVFVGLGGGGCSGVLVCGEI